MLTLPILSRFGELVEKAENATTEAVNQGRRVQEPAMTDLFLDTLETLIKEDELLNKHAKFQTKILGDRGRNSEERRYGSDFVAILTVNYDNFSITKGLLSQSKTERSGFRVIKHQGRITSVGFPTNPEREKLEEQIKDMRSVTSASFVTIIGAEGIAMVPSAEVIGLTGQGELQAIGAAKFFKDFLRCEFGDTDLTAWDDKTLDRLRIRTRSRLGFLLAISRYEDSLKKFL